jgi:hypothetical protein
VITLPIFPKLKIVMDFLVPTLIYLFCRWGLPRLRMTDPALRSRILWLLNLLPLIGLVMIAIELHAPASSGGHAVYVGVGPFHSKEMAQHLFRTHHLLPPSPPFRYLLLSLRFTRTLGIALALLLGLAEYLSVAARIRRMPSYEVEGVRILRAPGWSAFTFGLLRPQIYLSEAVWNSPHREAVLAHEQAHVRRRDPLARFVARAVQRLLWYLPFWKQVTAQIEFEAECACDARACQTVSRSRYARALLAFAEQAHSAALPLTASFGTAEFAEGSARLLARAKNLAHSEQDRTPRLFWPLFTLIYVLLILLA